MKLGFIYNPASGKGKAQNFREHFQSVLKNSFKEYIAIETRYPGHAKELIQKIGSKGVFNFIACGGDGTVNEVASELVSKKNYSLGIIPIGTGNDFSKNFKIPKNPKDALDFYLNENFVSTKCDTGTMWNNFFFNSLSFGFDASVALSSSKFKSAENCYLKAARNKLLLYPHKPAEIKIDNKHIHSGNIFFINIANGKTYGNGIPVAPSADTSDGLFNVTILEKAPLSSRPFLMKKVLKGIHITHPSFKFFKCRNISIKTNEKIDAQRDGLYFEMEHKADIKIHPESLTILTGS